MVDMDKVFLPEPSHLLQDQGERLVIVPGGPSV